MCLWKRISHMGIEAEIPLGKASVARRVCYLSSDVWEQSGNGKNTGKVTTLLHLFKTMSIASKFFTSFDFHSYHCSIFTNERNQKLRKFKECAEVIGGGAGDRGANPVLCWWEFNYWLSREIESLVRSICWFLWCQYSLQGGFETTNMMLLNIAGKRYI